MAVFWKINLQMMGPLRMERQKKRKIQRVSEARLP